MITQHKIQLDRKNKIEIIEKDWKKYCYVLVAI